MDNALGTILVGFASISLVAFSTQVLCYARSRSNK